MSLTSRHSTRSRSMRTGPVVSTRTGRHSPPGFHAGSEHSSAAGRPVMLRFDGAVALRRAGHLDREHVLVAESRQAVMSNECGKK